MKYFRAFFLTTNTLFVVVALALLGEKTDQMYGPQAVTDPAMLDILKDQCFVISYFLAVAFASIWFLKGLKTKTC